MTILPFANLSPEIILSAIESLGYQCNGSFFALNSYENRVYQIGLEDNDPIIAKFYRPQRWDVASILEEHSFSHELAQQEIPVIAPLAFAGKTLHEFADYHFAVFLQQSGRALELDNLEHLEWMGHFIGRIHAVGHCKPFQTRPILDIDLYGYRAVAFLQDHHFIPEELVRNYSILAKELLTKIAEIFQNIGKLQYLRIHGDFHPGNILWHQGQAFIVDLDDCCMGPAMQDLWMLLSGSREQMSYQLSIILAAYREFYDFSVKEIQLIEALRTLRMFHYSAWLAKRWHDPAFPLHFPWFNTTFYWQQQITELQEQLFKLNEMPLEVFF